MKDYKPNYHPEDALLASYTLGVLDEAVAVVVATHLEYCEECQEKCRQHAQNAGDALLTLTPDALNDNEMQEVVVPSEKPFEKVVVANNTESKTEAPQNPYTKKLPDFIKLPRTLEQNLHQNIAWKTINKGFQTGKVAKTENASCNLFWLKQGQNLPTHTHHGKEYLLVLSGSLADECSIAHAGDFMIADQTTTHTPYALSDCLCIAATTAPVDFTGIKGKVYNMLGLNKL